MNLCFHISKATIETFIKMVHSHEKKKISDFILLKHVGRSDLFALWDVNRLILEMNSFNNFIYIEFFFQNILLKIKSQNLLHVTNYFSSKKSFTANETINYQTSQTT